MDFFRVECAVGEDHVCIEVPIDCSVCDVLKKYSETTGRKGVSVWSSDARLEYDQLFADYFEPEATYLIKLANDFPEGSLMLKSGEKLESFGIDLTTAKLLMDVKAGPFDMEEFVTTVVEPEVNPTLLLLEWKPGFVIGGLAAVSWPKDERHGLSFCCAADQERKSFIFSLEPKVRRFDLLKPDLALMRRTNSSWRSFGFGNDLNVYDDGDCDSLAGSSFGVRDDASFPCERPVRLTRFELWAL
jgi:hypothetical protein